MKNLFLGHPQSRICTNEESLCISRTSEALKNPASSIFQSCGCLEDCNKTIYAYSKLIHKISSKHLQNYTSSGDYALESEISISYHENDFVGYKRILRSNMATLLSNIGAFLWLFLGASILSIIEVIYFFTLRFTNNLWLI